MTIIKRSAEIDPTQDLQPSLLRWSPSMVPIDSTFLFFFFWGGVHLSHRKLWIEWQSSGIMPGNALGPFLFF